MANDNPAEVASGVSTDNLTLQMVSGKDRSDVNSSPAKGAARNRIPINERL